MFRIMNYLNSNLTQNNNVSVYVDVCVGVGVLPFGIPAIFERGLSTRFAYEESFGCCWSVWSPYTKVAHI